MSPRQDFAGPGSDSGPADNGGETNTPPSLSAIVTADHSALRQEMDDTIALAAANGVRLPMSALTVMSGSTDPYRMDTEGNQKLAAWLAELFQARIGPDRRIHNRGLHYAILGQKKPDGTMYVSDEASWSLLEEASKVARWLGYIPYDQITDERNDPPIVRLFEPSEPFAYLNVGVKVSIPTADEIIPKLEVWDFEGVQPYKLVIVGEKSSLDPVLGPIAAEFGADLYLPTGDISNTMVYQMAKIGAEDGRPMRVVYFSDCDPSGWNMGIAIAHKLRAFKTLHFPDLDFQVHRAALTPNQVRGYIDRNDPLPSSPVKETDRRADAWNAAFPGVQQTEIDALATLRPNELRRIARKKLRQFYDADLAERVREAREDWLARAQAVIDADMGEERLAAIQAEAADKLPDLRRQIDELNSQLRVDVDDFDLPEMEVPESTLIFDTLGREPVPLVDSDWSFAEHTARLLASKRYEDGGQ